MLTAKEIDDAGVRKLDLARFLGMPYSTLTSKLSGYTVMTEEESDKIRSGLKKMKAGQKTAE